MAVRICAIVSPDPDDAPDTPDSTTDQLKVVPGIILESEIADNVPEQIA